MSTADKVWKIRRRLDDYLCRVDSRRATNLRAGLDEIGKKFSEVAVVGGMIRDVALAGTGHFRSDVDLVIVAPSRDVRRFATERDARPNRFGGFSTMLGSVKFDFWALEDTWASAQGLVNVNRLADVTRTTFFVLDAAVYDLKSKQLHLHPNYLNHLMSRTLDLNLRDNPSQKGNLVRAVRRVLREDLNVGPDLRLFLEWELTSESFSFINRKELELYGNSWSGHYRNHDKLLRALFDASYRKRARQGEFQFADKKI